jgi:hypothetical protein
MKFHNLRNITKSPNNTSLNFVSRLIIDIGRANLKNYRICQEGQYDNFPFVLLLNERLYMYKSIIVTK